MHSDRKCRRVGSAAADLTRLIENGKVTSTRRTSTIEEATMIQVRNARILSLVDCYDALTTNRPYRSPMMRQEVIDFFRRESGKAYDPAITQTFIDHLEEIELAGKSVVVEDGDVWGIKDTPASNAGPSRPTSATSITATPRGSVRPGSTRRAPSAGWGGTASSSSSPAPSTS